MNISTARSATHSNASCLIICLVLFAVQNLNLFPVGMRMRNRRTLVMLMRIRPFRRVLGISYSNI